MKEVIVTVGPRASGKSDFCERAIALDSSIVLISRDKILIELFGKTSLDPYTGGHEYAIEQMWKITKGRFKVSSDVRIILDTWSGSSQERARINRKLRSFGADQIVAWYFITPIEFVDKWFWKKPGVAKIADMGTRREKGLVFFCEDSPRHDYQLFHELASTIDSDGFDKVVRINPLTMKPKDALIVEASLDL